MPPEYLATIGRGQLDGPVSDADGGVVYASKALASPEYKAQYSKEHLIPIVMGRAEARRFTAEFAKEVTESLKELGVIT